MNYLLTILIFLPFTVGMLMLLVPPENRLVFRIGMIGGTAFMFALSLILFFSFDGQIVPNSWPDSFQFVERAAWIRLKFSDIGSLNVDYFVGIDGVSLPLVLLSSFILLIGAISSWTINQKVKGYAVLYMILGGSVIGCFAALDFFLFYLFFEFMLLPMFFLIGIWGSTNRQYASIKFFLYTLVGSLLILVVMIALYQNVQENGENTFSFIRILTVSHDWINTGLPGIFGYSFTTWAFWFLVIGFLIKVPSVPLHTWLPDAHVEAPTAVSVVLAGLLLKIGGYGLFRIGFGFFPEEAITSGNFLAIVGVVSILYGGLNAMAQTNLKRLVAYSSVSHMGFVVLGFAALNLSGVSGSVFQMVSHGLLSPAMFLLAGVIYDRTGDREIENFSGLATRMPLFSVMMGFFFFASLGLPGLSGFVGELLILIGSFGAPVFQSWIAPVAVVGILISAAYLLWTIQRMLFGKLWVRDDSLTSSMTDLTFREMLIFCALALFVLLLGIFPSLILDPIQNSLQFWVEHFAFGQR